MEWQVQTWESVVCLMNKPVTRAALHSSWLHTHHCLHPVLLAPHLGLSSWSVQGLFFCSCPSPTENHSGSRSMSIMRPLMDFTCAVNCQMAMIFSHLPHSESYRCSWWEKLWIWLITKAILSFSVSLHLLFITRDCWNPNPEAKYH